MAKLVAAWPIEHNGKRFETGQEVRADKDAIAELVKCGALVEPQEGPAADQSGEGSQGE